MKEIKNVLICGIGAIGSIYADIINKYSPDNLRVLVDKTRLDKYLKNPIVFNGKNLNLNYILPDDKSFKADLVIIATKYDGLKDAVKNLENFVYEDTLILSLLNGVTSEKIIAEKYGKGKLLYSYFIGHSAVRKDNCVTQDGVHTVVFGSFESDNSVRVKNYFDKVGINYLIPDDIIYSMWSKFMLNVAANQITAILRFTFGEMLSNKMCMELAVNVMKEVQLIAKAEGVKNSENLIDDTLKHLQTMTPEGKTSMLQDIEAKRKTEVDMFAGVIIDLGKKHNIETPYNKTLFELLKALES